ncbi:PAP-specific phosphatase [Corchorus olitorius]|uniref:PAP-specific phosphatase n=1 Tax=Corchorus olitorius TaxID=93759 RepID=A0A1R3L0P7_9ROSI|nr:PAP-specific phosphatase [Corchorus olitorius]
MSLTCGWSWNVCATTAPSRQRTVSAKSRLWRNPPRVCKRGKPALTPRGRSRPFARGPLQHDVRLRLRWRTDGVGVAERPVPVYEEVENGRAGRGEHLGDQVIQPEPQADGHDGGVAAKREKGHQAKPHHRPDMPARAVENGLPADEVIERGPDHAARHRRPPRRDAHLHQPEQDHIVRQRCAAADHDIARKLLHCCPEMPPRRHACADPVHFGTDIVLDHGCRAATRVPASAQ